MPAKEKVRAQIVLFEFIGIVLKISLASLLVGAGLSFFDITAIEILAKLGLTPEEVAELLSKGIQWALPNIMLGSFIIVPIWIVSYMLRPPRQR